MDGSPRDRRRYGRSVPEPAAELNGDIDASK